MVETNHAPPAGRFEFDALREANNYRKTLMREFGPCLQGSVIEIGAGIGQITEEVSRLPSVRRLVPIEPDPVFCREHRARLPRCELIEGFIDQADRESPWDAILSINVLEHIEQDASELAKYAGLLRRQSGCLCLFVPARPEIYAPIDRDFGHFRRYTKPELHEKLTTAGFQVLRLDYFNFVGYFAWWINFCLLKRRNFEPAKVRAFDRLIFPAGYFLESALLRPPFGQSLMAVAKASPTGVAGNLRSKSIANNQAP
jgi:hypothetical protein